MTVRVSEIYASTQGEGPRTGMGTIFLRFGGCNLRCPGWPCDTQFAIDPANRDSWLKKGWEAVFKETYELCEEKNIANVCLTGGEPFLQPHKDLELIVDALHRYDINVEVFTNGQIRYPDWAFEKLNFIMDWKLDGSGNAASVDEETLDAYLDNIAKLKKADAIKFVIKNEEDFWQAVELFYAYGDSTPAMFWAGVVWGQDFKEATLVDMIQAEKLPWDLNVQTHKYLWNPEARGV